MYDNKRHLRHNEIKVRFNDDDMEVIKAVANLTRSQRAVLIREYAMREIRRCIAEGLPETLEFGRP
ncbi:MAG: hypothetical protein ABTR07_11440 [Candidatus Competibacter denitrificans]|jgi:hypothetical protein